MIKFTDFFNVEFPEKTKVKFNMNDADVSKPAFDMLLNDEKTWIKMNAHRKKQASNNLDKAEYLLAFAQYYPYGTDYFIFGGMYRVEKKIPEVLDGEGYSLTLMDDYSAYIKRLIIKLNKPIGRDVYLRLYKNIDKLSPEIYELLPTASLGKFPGFNNVLLRHKDLQHIFKNEEPEWKNALSSVKGVYCITDTSNGQIYIGSAYGVNGIWGRWSNYADVDNLTGGNKAFEEIKESGKDHIIDNFQYSILEIMDTKTKDDVIINRESYWKKVFKSKEFGMNNN